VDSRVWLDATDGLGASCRRGDAPQATRGTAVGLRLFVRESSAHPRRSRFRGSRQSTVWLFTLPRKKYLCWSGKNVEDGSLNMGHDRAVLPVAHSMHAPVAFLWAW